MHGIPRPVALCASLLAPSFLPVIAHAQSAPVNQAPVVPAETQDADSGGDATAPTKKLQNPIGDLYSFPFLNNISFNYGPHGGA
jgi:hypothetical protein